MHHERQVSAAASSVNSGNFGSSRFQIQAAAFSLGGLLELGRSAGSDNAGPVLEPRSAQFSHQRLVHLRSGGGKEDWLALFRNDFDEIFQVRGGGGLRGEADGIDTARHML